MKTLALCFAMSGLALNAAFAKTDKGEYSKKSKAVDGTWLINTSYNIGDFEYYGNLALNADGTFTLHTTFGIAAENGLPEAGLSTHGGNYNVIMNGCWKKSGKCSYTFFGASVLTQKECCEWGIPNSAVARWTAEGEFTVVNGHMIGSYVTTLYAPGDTKLETPLELPQLTTNFEGDKLPCSKKKRS